MAPGFSGLEARQRLEKPFVDALQAWSASFLPQDGWWAGRWDDGSLLDTIQFEDPKAVLLRGRIYEIETQGLVPFEARLELGAGRLEAFQLWFGNAEDPRGQLPKATRPTWMVRDWLFQFSGP